MVGTAALNGYDTKERSKLNAKVTALGAMILAPFVVGAAEVIERLDPETAQDVLNVLGDNRFWYGVALTVAGSEIYSKHHARKKQGIAEAEEAAIDKLEEILERNKNAQHPTS